MKWYHDQAQSAKSSMDSASGHISGDSGGVAVGLRVVGVGCDGGGVEFSIGVVGVAVEYSVVVEQYVVR